MSSQEWILTYSGRRFYPLDPRIEDIAIEDIAHALSNICRFTGHVRTFYSVGEHSIRACLNAPKHLKLAMLLHDASEAYLCDLSRPVKHSAGLAPYRAAEDRLMGLIGVKYGVSEELASPMIKVIDDRMLMTERRDLMPPAYTDWGIHADPFFTPIEPLPPHTVEHLFLLNFAALTA